MSNKDLEGDDDTSDEDYKPEGEECVQLSEEESDGDVEENYEAGEEVNKSRKKRKSNMKIKNGKKRKGEVTEKDDTVEKAPAEELNEEEQKKRTDSLWADFLKDTDFKPKTKSVSITVETKPAIEESKVNCKPKTEKVKPPTVLEFAGEIVNIPNSLDVKQGSSQVSSASPTVTLPSKKARGGISSVLSQLGRKQKISTLEKSKLDWNNFKQQENIEDELQAYNKGKNG